MLLSRRRKHCVTSTVGHANLSRFPPYKIDLNESTFPVPYSCCVNFSTHLAIYVGSTFKTLVLFVLTKSNHLSATLQCWFLFTVFPQTEIERGCNYECAISTRLCDHNLILIFLVLFLEETLLTLFKNTALDVSCSSHKLSTPTITAW